MNLATLYRSLTAVCPVVSMLLGGIPLDAAEITFSFANAMGEGKWHGIIDAPNNQNYMTTLISASHPSDSITVEALPGNYKITFVVESGQKVKTSIGCCVVSSTDNPETITLVSPQKIYKNGSDISFSGAWNFATKDPSNIADNTPVIRDTLTPTTSTAAQKTSETPNTIETKPNIETQLNTPILETTPKAEVPHQPSSTSIEEVKDVELSNQTKQFKDSAGYCDSFVTRARRYRDTIVNIKPIHYDQNKRHTYYDTTSPAYCDEFIEKACCECDENDSDVKEIDDCQISDEANSFDSIQESCNASSQYCDDLIEHPSDGRITSMFVYPINRKKHVQQPSNPSEYCDQFIQRFGEPASVINEGPQVSTTQDCQMELSAPLAVFHISYPSANSTIHLDYGSTEKVLDSLHSTLNPIEKDIKIIQNTPHNPLSTSISIQAGTVKSAEITVEHNNFEPHNLPAIYISYAPVEVIPLAIDQPIAEKQKEDDNLSAIFISYSEPKIPQVPFENIDKTPSLDLNASSTDNLSLEKTNPFNSSPEVMQDKESAASLYDNLLSKEEELEITETMALNEILGEENASTIQLEASKIPQADVKQIDEPQQAPSTPDLNADKAPAAHLYEGLLSKKEELEITETKALHDILGEETNPTTQLETPEPPQGDIKQIDELENTLSTPSLNNTHHSEYSDYLIQRNEQNENVNTDTINPCVSFFMKFINRKYNVSQPQQPIQAIENCHSDLVTELSEGDQEQSEYCDYLIEHAEAELQINNFQK